MACPDIFDGFAVASEYLSKDIYRLASFNDIWLNLIPRGIFAPHTGLTHTVYTIGKSEPTTEDSGEAVGTTISLANGSNKGACAYSFTDVTVGFNEDTYYPVKLQWRGPLFCKDDQYFNHQPDRFLTAYVQEMAEYVRKGLNNHFHYNYIRRVPIYVARAAFSTAIAASATLTAPAATSELTQEMLDILAQQLVWNRATNPDSNGFVSLGSDGPLFSLQIGMEPSQLIALNNSEFRQDVRWADASLLMKRLGAGRVIKNFRHIPWATPARWSHNGTNYVRVPTFVTAAGAKAGMTTTVVNPDWISTSTAPYESANVLSPYVMESELIKPASRVGSVDWPDTNYLGEWMWKTGNDAIYYPVDGDLCDPLHKHGRHYAEFMHALKPGALPEAGAVIFFRRCPNTATEVTCS